MAIDYYENVWHNGKFIPWSEATIHVASHVVHYGSGVFEGIRCYKTEHGPAIFRLNEHVDRLINSAKIYRMEIGYTSQQLRQAMVELIQINRAEHAYLRPVVFRGLGDLGVNPLNTPVDAYILTWRWGKYLGHDALEDGIDVCVSSWNRLAPNTMPSMAKAAANYMNSQLIRMEAVVNGYTEGIALDHSGNVSEGSGENIFMVRDERVYTPPLASSVLPGITRDAVITLTRELGLPVIEEAIPREALYIADEVFFTGTAAEVSPIRSVDRIVVGKGKPGPITRKLQDRLLSIAQGRAEDKYGWLTLCHEPVAAT
ncbi:MAG: branched-chain amino acid transaminase [Terriglobia bacterium]